jgi:hypothetical protein
MLSKLLNLDMKNLREKRFILLMVSVHHGREGEAEHISSHHGRHEAERNQGGTGNQLKATPSNLLCPVRGYFIVASAA